MATDSTNPAVLKPKYDPIADFAPVGKMAQTSNVLVVGEKNKTKSLKEFLAQARVESGGMNPVMPLNQFAFNNGLVVCGSGGRSAC